MTHARILDIATYLPTAQVTNADLEARHPGWSGKKIERKVGIASRHVAAPDETAADMATEAAKTLLSRHDAADVDFLLFCTQTPDYLLPTSACMIQNRLGLSTRCGALDFNLGCSGFVYGLSLAKGLIASGQAKRVLLLTAETYTKHLHPKDASNQAIFGDGATATLIEATDAETDGLGTFVFGTDGAGSNQLIVPNGGARHLERVFNADGEQPGHNDNYLRMRGPEVFDFTLETIPPLVAESFAANNISPDEVDWVVFHQANEFMLKSLLDRIEIGSAKFYMNMRETGNTVSSTIPIALCDLWNQGEIAPGKKVLVIGFGVGLSWAGTLLTF
ncbi:MAG: ketoacyl-ACP synthase III [Phycisphaerales bacterium]|jgi:3-oxoacyl-[acyl-carrier-protein] synthase III|nr:ketoacyl-ACP synthase III [Phycisphaerales bacterium]MBT7171179.1 ketoacyl-ACP synthase III [Phycisphaerales bacterium]